MIVILYQSVPIFHHFRAELYRSLMFSSEFDMDFNGNTTASKNDKQQVLLLYIFSQIKKITNEKHRFRLKVLTRKVQ